MEHPSKISAATSRAKPDRKLSASEVRDFVSKLERRDPQQLLGPAAQGSLTSGLVLATLGTVVAMAGLTIGPYAWGLHAAKPESAETSSAESQPQPAASPASESTAQPPAASATTANTDKSSGKAAAETASATPNQQKIAEKLGLDEVKQASPDENPLDRKIDDLMDNLK